MSQQAMYRWRHLSEAQRLELLSYRRSQQLPWHSPPHYGSESGVYLITAACFEHRHVIGSNPQRMAAFEQTLLATCGAMSSKVHAWTVLPNHYHILVCLADVKTLLASLGRLHGRTSFQWNGEENCRGRKVWFNAAETVMKSERHYWASLIYVLHNAVKHGYVSKWQNWPFYNAKAFLDQVGREQVRRLWEEYPINDYGTTWDPAEL